MDKKHVILKPRAGSARFKQSKAASAMSLLQEVEDGTGRKNLEMQGAYTGERLPNTRGWRRPMFSSGKRRWLLIKDNGEPADAEWVNNLVVKCFFYHEHGPRKGEPIMHADLGNVDDPFFNHSQLDYLQEEGIYKFDTEDPIQQILIAGERARLDEVTTTPDGAQKSHVRFLLLEGQDESGITQKAVKKKVEAYKLLSAMGLAKKKIVVQILKNVEFTSEVGEDILDVELHNYIEGGVKTASSGRTMLEEFIYIAKLDGARLETTERVQRALRRSIIKRTGSVYNFNGKPIGNKMGDLVDYFFSTENSEEYERLILKLGDDLKG